MHTLCVPYRRGYKEDEVEEAFKKFDTDGNRVLDADEQARMLKALQDEKVLFLINNYGYIC